MCQKIIQMFVSTMMRKKRWDFFPITFSLKMDSVFMFLSFLNYLLLKIFIFIYNISIFYSNPNFNFNLPLNLIFIRSNAGVGKIGLQL